MVAPLPERSTLGAIGFSPELLEWCSKELEAIGSVEPVPNEPGQLFRAERFDLLLVALMPPLAESLAAFSSVRRSHALVPLIALAEGVDANFAAELLKCGAEDFLLLPPSAEALRHKVRRALGDAVGPAFDVPEFAAFKPRPFDENQRRCFRVNIPPDFAVASVFPGPVERALEVKDLSIETEEAPGGMQVAADRATARRLPFDQWNRRREIEVAVQLPTGSPITTRARLVPGLRHGPDGSIRFAIEYWVTRPAEKERFRRYWVEVQRRTRRTQMSQRRMVIASPNRK
jgi:CheY-like chemotaxis protein